MDSDRAKILEKAFAMLDEDMDEKMEWQTLNLQAPPQKPIDCYEAAQAYGGMLMVDYRKEDISMLEDLWDWKMIKQADGGMPIEKASAKETKQYRPRPPPQAHAQNSTNYDKAPKPQGVMLIGKKPPLLPPLPSRKHY